MPGDGWKPGSLLYTAMSYTQLIWSSLPLSDRSSFSAAGEP